MKERDIECASVVDELAGLLYGELEGEVLAGVEEHLTGCASCRAELESLRGTRDGLDLWTPLEDEDASAVARSILGRRRRSGVRAAWIGIAAALVAFFGLASTGAELDYDDGRVALRFELPWIDARRGPLRETVQDIARAQVEAELASWSESQLDRFADWSLREEEQRMHLALAVDNVRRQDREALEAYFGAVQRGAVRENEFTREAIYQLASLVAPEGEQGNQESER